jgi:hypothetical protein
MASRYASLRVGAPPLNIAFLIAVLALCGAVGSTFVALFYRLSRARSLVQRPPPRHAPGGGHRRVRTPEERLFTFYGVMIRLLTRCALFCFAVAAIALIAYRV